MFNKSTIIVLIISLFLPIGATIVYGGREDLQKQVDEIKAALPRFAIPMRKVGEGFQNMYYAAKGGNWGSASYMSR